jgi:hypothetical protein
VLTSQPDHMTYVLRAFRPTRTILVIVHNADDCLLSHFVLRVVGRASTNKVVATPTKCEVSEVYVITYCGGAKMYGCCAKFFKSHTM